MRSSEKISDGGAIKSSRRLPCKYCGKLKIMCPSILVYYDIRSREQFDKASPSSQGSFPFRECHKIEVKVFLLLGRTVN